MVQPRFIRAKQGRILAEINGKIVPIGQLSIAGRGTLRAIRSIDRVGKTIRVFPKHKRFKKRTKRSGFTRRLPMKRGR